MDDRDLQDKLLELQDEVRIRWFRCSSTRLHSRKISLSKRQVFEFSLFFFAHLISWNRMLTIAALFSSR